MKQNEKMTRREFTTVSGATAAGVLLGGQVLYSAETSETSLPAILGGKKLKFDFSMKWPILQGSEEESVLRVLRSGNWCRAGGTLVDLFEKKYAELCGAKFAIATNSGTSALNASLAALNIGPYDEVVTTPYTFVATINCILNSYAIPVLVDSDPETFLIDIQKTGKAVNTNTAAFIPVHIGGSPVDLDPIIKIGKDKSIPVIEDACQAHLGEYKGRKLGSIADFGCFSFQVTKNLACGDGGSVLTSNEEYANLIYAAQNNSRGKVSGYNFKYNACRGSNLRMTEFQAAVLCAQMNKIAKDADIRNENGLYLNSLLEKIPGLYPAKICQGGRSAWHLYMFRINEKEFGLSRNKLLQALSAEGIPASCGYTPEDWPKYIERVYDTKAGRRIYSKKFLDDLRQRTDLTNFNKLCADACWFMQAQLLAPKSDMDKIADVLRRIQKNAKQIHNL